MKNDQQDILVSWDVSSLFRTNVPVDETIEVLVEKAFKGDWFNEEYDKEICMIMWMGLLLTLPSCH